MDWVRNSSQQLSPFSSVYNIWQWLLKNSLKTGFCIGPHLTAELQYWRFASRGYGVLDRPVNVPHRGRADGMEVSEHYMSCLKLQFETANFINSFYWARHSKRRADVSKKQGQRYCIRSSVNGRSTNPWWLMGFRDVVLYRRLIKIAFKV